MHDYFTIEGTKNVVDIKKYKAFKETKKLFINYKTKIFQSPPEWVEAERVRIKEELRRYPNHLLTKVKVQIFENVTQSKL